MNRLTDKLIVLVLCLTCYLQSESGSFIVVPVLCAVAAAALVSYLERDAVTLGVFLAYCAACVAFPACFFFVPLLLYDMALNRWRYASFAALIPLVAGVSALPALAMVFIVLFVALAVLMRLRTASLEKTRSDYIRLRDAAQELSVHLENQNRELMEKQDYEVNLARLNERNRIARDIHDNMGHLLSNALLQTGALMASCGDGALCERLQTLRGTLAQGMDSIRESVHDLHDESVDLYAEMKALVDGFRFCSAELEYNLSGNPDRKVKYAMIAIVKEALANVARHSDARQVRISVQEHPALYQLIVRDNGSKKDEDGGGIGLKNIEQRVNGLRGTLTIGRENGFTVFASIPKE